MPLDTLGFAGLQLDPVRLIDRCAQAFTGRSNFANTWERIRRLMLPDSAPFFAQGSLMPQSQGQRDRETTVDTYAQYCVRLHATFLYGAIINGGTDWVRIVASSNTKGRAPDRALVDWCEEERDRLTEILMAPSTGFTDQFYAMLVERTAFGNGVLYGGDRPGGLPIAKCAPLRDTAWEGGDGHEPDTFWWKQTLTAAEWKRKLGDMAGAEVCGAADDANRRTNQYTFIHGVMENPEWVPNAIDQQPAQRQFLSLWLNEREQSLVSRKWLTSNPYTAFRAMRRPNENCGRGPGDEMLEEAGMTQRVRVATIRGVEKSVDPLMLLPSDGVLTPPTNESEGAMVIEASMMRGAGDPVRYLKSEARPDIGQEFLRDGCYAAMDRAVGKDLMSLPREARMLDSQMVGIQEEQSRGIVPLVSPLFAPTARFISRFWDIARRSGRMRPPPASARGFTLSLEFSNPLEKAGRLAEVRAIMQAMSMTAQGAEIDPGAMHALKIVPALQHSYEVLGVPRKFIATPDEIKVALQVQAQQAQQKQQMETALDASTVLKNGGAGLSKMMPQGGASGAAQGPTQ